TAGCRGAASRRGSVVVANANDLKRSARAQWDRVARVPPGGNGAKGRRIGRRPAQPLEPEGEGHPVLLSRDRTAEAQRTGPKRAGRHLRAGPPLRACDSSKLGASGPFGQVRQNGSRTSLAYRSFESKVATPLCSQTGSNGGLGLVEPWSRREPNSTRSRVIGGPRSVAQIE